MITRFKSKIVNAADTTNVHWTVLMQPIADNTHSINNGSNVKAQKQFIRISGSYLLLNILRIDYD